MLYTKNYMFMHYFKYTNTYSYVMCYTTQDTHCGWKIEKHPFKWSL